MTPTAGHAVVLGASMAGLVTARVLAEAFERVTVIDRDHLPDDGQPRRGVPQGGHLHGLLAGGCEALEDLFDGFVSEVADAGGHVGDTQDDARWYFGGGRYRQAPSGLRAIGASRPLVEAHVRRRVRGLPGVDFLEGRDARGLTAVDGRVTGVRVGPRGDSDDQALPADLVVDASGRGSHLPVWLEALGCARPEREQVRIGLGYTTRHYRLGRDQLDGDIAVIVGSRPRGGALMAQENGHAVVTLMGYLGDHAPTDPEGFVAFAESLPVDDIHGAIRDAEPLDDPVAIRIPAGVRHRYERLRHFPDGLLVLGDAMCHFNPMYAQGMSVAALQALALRDCLRRRGTTRLGRRFLRRAARVVDRAWDPVVSADLQLPGVEGPKPPMPKAVTAYVGRAHAAAAHDPRVARAFLRVSNLVDPPPRLLHPATATRVLRAGRHRDEVTAVDQASDPAATRPA